MMRLETIAPDLANELRIASPAKRRQASLVACQLALEETSVDMRLMAESLEGLRTLGALPNHRVKELSELANQLDERYFELQERVEGESGRQNEALKFFGQARAVSALSFAGGLDDLVAALESIYEAASAIDDENRIYDAVRAIL